MLKNGGHKVSHDVNWNDKSFQDSNQQQQRQLFHSNNLVNNKSTYLYDLSPVQIT